MSDDDKRLPARVEPARLPTAPQSRSLIGWVGSAFNAILNTKTFQKKTEEADAYRQYLEESARIPKAMLERDREVDNYLYSRDAIIESDRQERQRELDKRWAERKIEAEDDIHKVRMARLERKSEEAQAQRELERSRWGLDAFKISLPYRRERIAHISQQGTAEAAGDMIATLRELSGDDEEKEKPAVPHAPTLEDELAYIEKLIDEWQDAATPEQMHLFYKKRAQLKGRIEEEKNRSI
jgi:hypothetical protein